MAETSIHRYVWILLYGLLILSAEDVSGQAVVRGSVLDAHSKEPLEAVSITSGEYGSTTNRAGQFVLKLESLPAVLAISMVGYEAQRIPVQTDEEPARILLIPAVVELPGVDVFPESFALDLLKHARRRAAQLDNRVYDVAAFMRQVTRVSGEVQGIVEAFYASEASYQGLRRWELEHGRYGFLEDSGHLIEVNGASLLPLLIHPYGSSRRARVPLARKAETHFSFRVSALVQDSSRTLAVLEFTPKSRAINMPEGRLYIDAETHTLARYVGTIPTGPGALATDSTYLAAATTIDFDLRYRIAEHDAVVPDRLDIDVNVGGASRADANRTGTSITVFFYQYLGSVGAAGRRAPSLDWSTATARRVLDSTAYDPVFWRDNEVIARVPVENEVVAQLESKQLIGNLPLSTTK